MKIICLTRLAPPLIYFVNKIDERYKISLVVLERPSREKKLLDTFKSKGLLGSVNSLKRKLTSKIGEKIREKRNIIDYNKYFSDKWKFLYSNIPILPVRNINSQEAYERLKQENPDLILCHGTSLVKDPILETSSIALNLHWGLSPYYRGGECTQWALINWDPYNIGVTIHKLTKIIDGGDILAQKRAIINSGDTVHSINMQLTYLGTHLILKAIDKLDSGEQLQFQQQKYSLGYITNSWQWSEYLSKQTRYIERKHLIDKMLRKPSRKQKLPIVEI